jgi:hypothetical protein
LLFFIPCLTHSIVVVFQAALPLGGVRPIDARRTLEVQRISQSGDESDDEESTTDRYSHDFSLELAYVIEHYSEETKGEALGILYLYLQGANSITLAVAYAQRQRQHSSILWDKLISHCLLASSKDGKDKSLDGALFGSLLEAAALSGADLARLVAKIPPGMAIEGLRRRLAAAVADYRLKVDIHEAAGTAATADRIALLREVTHRSRRGVLYQISTLEKKPKLSLAEVGDAEDTPGSEQVAQTLPKTLRTVERRDRYSLSFTIPMR